MSKQVEQSIKAKLKSISKEQLIPFSALLNTLFLERFLARITKSKYSEKLIFKGGMCLAQYIDLKRETRDLDFLLSDLQSNLEYTQKMMEEIAALKLNDHFHFSQISVKELSLKHKKYPGYRVTVKGKLGQMTSNVTIDMGVGDIVRPKVIDIELLGLSNTPLFESGIDIKSYPPEYIFSEKLEAIIYLDKINSRMKDYYDCYRLIKENVMDDEDLKLAIRDTFENRNTTLTLISVPAEELRTIWNQFINKNKFEKIDLEIVISEINIVISKFLDR